MIFVHSHSFCMEQKRMMVLRTWDFFAAPVITAGETTYTSIDGRELGRWSQPMKTLESKAWNIRIIQELQFYLPSPEH